MPGIARLVIPCFPHHVLMTSHNGEAAFADADEYRYLLTNLRLLRHEFGVELYAFCVLPHCILMILNPGREPRRMGLLMKRLAGRQTGYVNARRARHGTLWRGRYRSSPIDPKTHLIPVCRYIELAPVRAGLATTPESYVWSSCRDRLSGARNHWIETHDAWRDFASTEQRRIEKYRAYLSSGIPEDEYSFIDHALRREQLTGRPTFIDQVERLTGRRVEFRGRGRPKGALSASQKLPPLPAEADDPRPSEAPAGSGLSSLRPPRLGNEVHAGRFQTIADARRPD
jgi:putative transposase